MSESEVVVIEKLVHGGQGLARLANGQRVFVWGVLPGESVKARIIKRKKSFAEAVADEIVQALPERLAPRDSAYLATSPWQIVPFARENEYKKQIVTELFAHEHVQIPESTITTAEPQWNYRNKMEYSFWGDEHGLHLALHQRGSHQKQVVQGSALAMPAVDKAANALLAQLQAKAVRAGDLKTIVVRCNQAGQAVASLFVKPQTFTELILPAELCGLTVYHSNPKSPASVATKLLQKVGEPILQDSLLGRSFAYDAESFFQVNLPVFEQALAHIRNLLQTTDDIVDMYAGVGSIGLSVAKQKVRLIELDSATAAMAHSNAFASHLDAEVIQTSTEKALDYITNTQPVIFDPPRAGLHDKVVARTLQTKPPQVIYLSCNPATQARDLAKLQTAYKITHFEVFNFFPHTPHIETMAVLSAAR